jgi:hypothetical protein
MNLYFVLSEQLMGPPEYGPYLPDTGGPGEPYRICELVVARNPSQARYMAWKEDRESFSDDLRDMPRMHIHLKAKDVGRFPAIVSDNPRYQEDYYWCGKDPIV